MAHFAKLDESNVVEIVIVINNEILMIDGEENEQLGINFCKSLFGENTNWKQTSYNNNFRGVYAGIGFTYDFENDVFIAPNNEKNDDLEII